MTEPNCAPGGRQPDDGTPDEPGLVIRLRIPAPAPRTTPPPGAATLRVVTEGAVYVFDARTMTAVRLRRTGSQLRRDGEPLTLLSWPDPVVGHGMQLQLLVREDGTPTTRFTSAVVRVEP